MQHIACWPASTCCLQAEKGDLLQTNLGGFGGPAATGGSGSGGAAPPAAAVTKIKLKVVKKDKKVGAGTVAGSACQPLPGQCG